MDIPGFKNGKVIEFSETDPFEILLTEYRSPEFIKKVCFNLERLIHYKLNKYQTIYESLISDILKQERQLSLLSEKERDDTADRFLLISNKTSLGRIREIMDKAIALKCVFLQDQWPDYIRKNMSPAVLGTRRAIVGHQGATAKETFETYIKNSLSSIIHDPLGFPLLDSEARQSLKSSVARVVLSLGSTFEIFLNKYLNFVLMGSPGVGKTTAAQSIGFIMGSILILLEGSFKSYTPSDFTAQFEGQSSAKTRSLLIDGLENIIFLDEAYGLINCSAAASRSYGIDVINEMVDFMSKYRGLYVFIIAGYEDQ